MSHHGGHSARRGSAARKQRQQEAQQRADARAERTAAEQLMVLDRRLGLNRGADKERARLAKLLRRTRAAS